jgi:hypothetical protein
MPPARIKHAVTRVASRARARNHEIARTTRCPTPQVTLTPPSACPRNHLPFNDAQRRSTASTLRVDVPAIRLPPSGAIPVRASGLGFGFGVGVGICRSTTFCDPHAVQPSPIAIHSRHREPVPRAPGSGFGSVPDVTRHQVRAVAVPLSLTSSQGRRRLCRHATASVTINPLVPSSDCRLEEPELEAGAAGFGDAAHSTRVPAELGCRSHV